MCMCVFAGRVVSILIINMLFFLMNLMILHALATVRDILPVLKYLAKVHMPLTPKGCTSCMHIHSHIH